MTGRVETTWKSKFVVRAAQRVFDELRTRSGGKDETG